jgi:hypothetical protein
LANLSPWLAEGGFLAAICDPRSGIGSST